MKCPACGHSVTKVNDSRVGGDGSTIRRRRECLQCAFRFSTNEEIMILDLVVKKRDGATESYNREKIMNGLHHSLQKRPYSSEDIEKLLHAIETDIQKSKKNPISTDEIGEMVMAHLEPFDKVAYIRFASVYRQFEDVTTFQEELEKLAKKVKKKGK